MGWQRSKRPSKVWVRVEGWTYRLRELLSSGWVVYTPHMDLTDPAERLVLHPRFEWRDGMLDRLGARLVLDSWKHCTTETPDGKGVLNLADPATAGVLLAVLDSEGLLTDVVREEAGWIVAIRTEDGLEGYIADSLGEAAAWALLAGWGEDVLSAPPT